MQRLKDRLTLILLFVAALIGVSDATYLTYEHYHGNNVICSITHGCEQVLTSQFSTIAGIPISFGGIFFYLALLAFGFYALRETISLRARQTLVVFTAIGFLVSVVLTGLQAFVIHAWCQFCLLSAVTATAVFILSIVLYRKFGHQGEKHGESRSHY